MPAPRSHFFSLSLGVRRLCLLLAVCSWMTPTAAVAFDIGFGFDETGCACALSGQPPIEGCLQISPVTIHYDIVITGLTNADVTSVDVVRANAPDSCTPAAPEAVLFSLERYSTDPAAPARFRGAVTRPAGGTCPTDPGDCFTQGEALAKVVLDTAQECLDKVIKDVCTVPVPAVSEWGVAVMAGIVMTIGTIILRRL